MPGGGWVATYSDMGERRAAEERQTLLMRELDHRAKNALAVVQAALRLTPKDDAEAYARAVGGRVNALARAHTLLAKGQWSGAELRDLAWGELAPFLGGAPAADGQPQPRAALDGPEVMLTPGAAQALSMALHELATNATKHGALSAPEGRVSMFWEVDEGAGLLRVLWTEAGGPPVATPPSRRGFGSRVLEATLRDQLGGRLTREWRASGLVCAIELPLARALAGQALLRPIRTGLEPDFVPSGAGRASPQGTGPTDTPRGGCGYSAGGGRGGHGRVRVGPGGRNVAEAGRSSGPARSGAGALPRQPAGSRTMKRAPTTLPSASRRFSAAIFPRRPSTICRLIERPRPECLPNPSPWGRSE
jgi:two-component sensor histidine kinase